MRAVLELEIGVFDIPKCPVEPITLEDSGTAFSCPVRFAHLGRRARVPFCAD
jgi:hypothetical protein